MLHHMLRAAAGRDRIPTDGIAFHWDSTGQTAPALPDLSGSGNDATLQGGAQIETPGWELVDSGDFLRLDAPMMIPAGESVSFSAWLNFDGIPSGAPGFWRAAGPRVTYPEGYMSGDQFMILEAPSRRPWIRWDGTDVLKPSSGFAVPLGQWVHLVYVFKSGAKAEVWANGVREHSATTTVTTPAFEVEIFGAQSGPDQFLDGHHNQYRWYRRALAPDEIVSLYNEGSPA